MSSIKDISTCAFAKGILQELFSSNVGVVRTIGEPQPKFFSRIVGQRFELYNQLFHNLPTFQTDRKTFIDKFSKIIDQFKNWGKRHSGAKNKFLELLNA